MKTVDECAAFAKPIWRTERGRCGRAKVEMPMFQPSSWGQRSAIALPNSHLRMTDRALVEQASYGGQRSASDVPTIQHRSTPRDGGHAVALPTLRTAI